MTNIIKKCTGCGLEMTAEQIINDPNIRPIGMSFIDIDADSAFYFFQHDIDNCGTCFVVKVDKFTDFIDENIPAKNMKLSKSCSRHCTDIKSLNECGNNCHKFPLPQIFF